jgi:phospholipid/cholesterol/gamma-HCH transport system substrate-binding protein
MKISREIKVGVVFVLATAILIWGLMYLKGLELLKTSRTFYAVYDQVNGLVPANPVSIKGVKVGQVQKVFFDEVNPEKIIVELYILGDYPIAKNSVARIYSSSLLGSQEVEIVPGDARAFAEDGDTLLAFVEANLGAEVKKQLIPLTGKAENLIGSIDSLARILQEVLNKNTRNNLVDVVEHLKETLANLAGTTQTLDTLLGSQRNNLAKIISNVESISSNLKNNNARINNILTNFSNLSDSLAKAKIPATLGQVNKAVTELDSVLVKINSGQGSLGQLVNNKVLYNELEKAARDLNLLLEDIRKNPSKYVKVSVF